MPIAQLVKNNASIAETMRQELISEWNPLTRQVTPLGASENPVLIEDKPQMPRFGERPSTHLYVIWDKWEPLSQAERSEIIMDAYETTHDLPDVVRVTVAIGLTKTEATRRGLQYRIVGAMA